VASGRTGTFPPPLSYLEAEVAMRAYLARLAPKTRMLLTIPLILVAYPVVMIVLPAIIHALVPDVVRSVLSLI
jgi:hypothetical protein